MEKGIDTISQFKTYIQCIQQVALEKIICISFIGMPTIILINIYIYLTLFWHVKLYTVAGVGVKQQQSLTQRNTRIILILEMENNIIIEGKQELSLKKKHVRRSTNIIFFYEQYFTEILVT